MQAVRFLHPLVLLCTVTALPGCLFAPKTQLSGCQARNRTLAEQNRAQLAEIENLKIHARGVENRLIHTEKELVLLEDEIGLDRRQLAGYQRERATLNEQFQRLAAGDARLPADIGHRLEKLSEQYPSLHFDPATGLGKLYTDVMFDNGQAEIKPDAEKVIGRLVAVLNSPEASGLKVLVAGHTDNRRMAKKPGRDKYPSNFHLSTARAHAVAEVMRHLGFPAERIAVAGFGSHQPIAPNITPKDRVKNRRVEIFVMAEDVPVVGWTDSIPSMY